jgi:hypothetical protein
MFEKLSNSRFGMKKFFSIVLLLSTLVFHLSPVLGACPGETLPDSYLAALADSSVATQDKISKHLIALVPFEDQTNRTALCGDKPAWQWDPTYNGFPSRIKVVTFVSRQTYEQNYKPNLDKHAETFVLRKSLWVTVAPEMRNFFSRKIFKDAGQCPPTAERVGQVLGLNPYSQGEVFIEMWIEPQYLFRPSADPAISDHEAEVATQLTTGHWFFPSDPNPFMTLNDYNLYKEAQWKNDAVTFKEWYTNRAQTIYTVAPDACAPYPWTRLGYTYDWGEPHRAKHEGLSEFVVRLEPDVDGGAVVVELIRAIDSQDQAGWASYFRCSKKCD